MVLGYSDNEFISMSGYELVHPDDLKYYANSHKECKNINYLIKDLIININS